MTTTTGVPDTATSVASVNIDFTSSVPWDDERADCLAVTCSDQRFRLQHAELLQHLGFQHPHIIQLPGGLAIAHPLVSAFGFLSKAADSLLDKALDATGVEDIVCIAHEDCAAYKVGRSKLIDMAVRGLAGKPMREIQIEHLRKAASRLKTTLRGATVRAFYADLVEENNSHLVHFEEVKL